MKKKSTIDNKDHKSGAFQNIEIFFTKKELHEIKNTLIAMRKTLLKDIDTSIKEGSSKDASEPSGDMYDMASNERDREISYMLGDRERKKLKEIDSALSKIEDGTYGTCEECGETISKKRLKIIPYSSLCVNCQSNAEKEEKEKQHEEYGESFRNISINDEDDTFNHSEE
jgi:DnaK suppressor protein